MYDRELAKESEIPPNSIPKNGLQIQVSKVAVKSSGFREIYGSLSLSSDLITNCMTLGKLFILSETST